MQKRGSDFSLLIFWSKIESKVAYYVLFYRPWSFKAKIWAAPCYLFAEKVVRPFEQVTDKQKERKRLKKNKSSHSEIKSLIFQKKYNNFICFVVEICKYRQLFVKQNRFFQKGEKDKRLVHAPVSIYSPLQFKQPRFANI